MIDQRTPLENLELPSASNTLAEDVVRLRSMINTLDTKLHACASLGANGRLVPEQLPFDAIIDFLGTVSTQASMLQLVGQKGDWCHRTDDNKAYVLTGSNPASLASWTAWPYPSGPSVLSVNSRTGAILLTKSDVGLDAVENTSDLAKPISTAVQAALASKQATVTGAASSVVVNLLTASRAVISDGFGRIAVSTVTANELSYLSGVTGGLQAQIDAKVGRSGATGSAYLPAGTTAQRDGMPVTGAIRFNVTTANFEGYYGAAGWRAIGDTIALANISDWPATVSADEVGFLDGVTSAIQGQLNSLSSSINSVNAALSGKQALDSDLTAIAGLTGSYGYLRKTAEGTWTIDAGSGGGGGTVTSVGLTAPSLFNVTGSPVTTLGTLGLTLANQSANQIFAGPASGGAASPTFRALTIADIPSLSSLYQPLDGDLTSIAGLSSTSGILIKTAANNWTLTTSLNNTPIGSTGPSSGAFTTLTASSTVGGSGFTNLFAAPPAIGGSSPNVGSFSNLTYSGALNGGTGTINIGNYQFYKDSSGRIGLGLATSNWTIKSLEINSAGSALYSGASGQLGISAGCYYSGGWKFAGSGVKAGFIEIYDGSIGTVTTASTGSPGAAMSSVQGPYVAPGGTTWTTGSSDARQKKNFAPVSGLDALLLVEPVAYHFDWESDLAPKRLGFTAQNLRTIIPEMVVEKRDLAPDGTPLLTIVSDYLLPVLVQAIKDLSAQVDELRAGTGIGLFR